MPKGGSAVAMESLLICVKRRNALRIYGVLGFSLLVVWVTRRCNVSQHAVVQKAEGAQGVRTSLPERC